MLTGARTGELAQHRKNLIQGKSRKSCCGRFGRGMKVEGLRTKVVKELGSTAGRGRQNFRWMVQGTDIGGQTHDFVGPQALPKRWHLALDSQGDDSRDISVSHPDIVKVGSFIPGGIGPVAMRAFREK